jgi:tRNA pseudouridine55 synthase
VASIGHLGTLDPMATGLLPLCLGAGTKIAQFLAAERKAYEGEIRLGVATDTLDVTGRVTAEAAIPSFDAVDLERVAARLTGHGEQRPPMYSAVKVGGRELYKLARAGIEVDRAPRPIEIYSLRLEPGRDDRHVRFAVECSKGTYVRVLAEDIGRALGTVAALASLRRTGFGSFAIAQAVPLDDLLALPPGGPLPVLGVREALRPLREIAVGREIAHALGNGRQAALGRLPGPDPAETLAAVIGPDGELLAVVEKEAGAWALKRVLAPKSGQLYSP